VSSPPLWKAARVPLPPEPRWVPSMDIPFICLQSTFLSGLKNSWMRQMRQGWPIADTEEGSRWRAHVFKMTCTLSLLKRASSGKGGSVKRRVSVTSTSQPLLTPAWRNPSPCHTHDIYRVDLGAKIITPKDNRAGETKTTSREDSTWAWHNILCLQCG
jgi:hypothetical protein